MAGFGLIVHQGRPEAAEAALELSRWLVQEGHDVRMPAEEAAASGCAHLGAGPEHFREGLDVVVTLGGDGSILRAVELVGTTGVPVLGVNFGRLGYLSEVKPGQARSAIERVLSGDFRIEERLLLAAEVRLTSGAQAGGGVAGLRRVALNEAFIERGPSCNSIRFALHVDGEKLASYCGDGLIVATPTGSTAYSFSVRGPIIDPTHRALLVTPVSPHMLFDRSLVVPAATRLRIVVEGHRAAMLSVDGRRVVELDVGDEVECSTSPHAARFVRFGERRFLRALKAKFGLNGPPGP